jgi:tripartite-type tricarboxylate transporter receptor subunit TctC
MSIDLAQDVVPAGIAPVADLIEMHRAGKLRIIATSGATRVAQLAEVPTFAEQGYPEVQATGWVGIFAPAGTPQRTIDEWSAAFVKAVRSPETSSRIIELGVEPTGTTPEELGAIVAADIARWGPIIKLSGFHAD